MERVAEREINHDAEHNDDDVVGPSGGSGRHDEIDAALGGDAGITPQVRNDPNNRIEPRSPFESRCAKAQVFIPASTGCFALALMWLGMNTAMTRMTAGTISPIVMCRMNAGGDQTWIHSCARYCAKPQTISARPTSETSANNAR